MGPSIVVFITTGTETIPCPICDGELKHYDRRCRRSIDHEGGKHTYGLRRLRCKECNRMHTELPYLIVPYKRHSAAVIVSVTEHKHTSVPYKERTRQKIRAWCKKVTTHLGGLAAASGFRFRVPSDCAGLHSSGQGNRQHRLLAHPPVRAYKLHGLTSMMVASANNGGFEHGKSTEPGRCGPKTNTDSWSLALRRSRPGKARYAYARDQRKRGRLRTHFAPVAVFVCARRLPGTASQKQALQWEERFGHRTDRGLGGDTTPRGAYKKYPSDHHDPRDGRPDRAGRGETLDSSRPPRKARLWC